MKSKKNQERIMLFLIFALGAFLRFFRLEENLYFSGEIGHNLLTIKDAFIHGTIPLIGPPTSHPWLFFGPLFYWLYGPLLVLSGFNPLSHQYFGAVVAWLILPLNYFVIKRIFNLRVALFSTFLIAISPLFLEFAHFARFFSFVPLLVYPFLYFLFRIINGENRYVFWFAFVYGTMFSFHFTPLMLLPFVITFFILKKITFTKEEVFATCIGFIIPMLPFLLYDAMHGMQMTLKMILWIPYRVAGFLGIIPKNTISTQVLQENTSSLFSFVEKSFLPQDKTSIAIVLLLALLLYFVWKYEVFFSKRLAISTNVLLVLLWFSWGCLAVFIHGSPPLHYFLPILPAPIVLFSLLFDRIWNKKSGRYIIVGILIIITLVNMRYYFSSKWFFTSQTVGDWSRQDIPYTLQKKVAETIIRDANGEKFMLKRVGVNDQFEEDYAQNYMYLLWLLGNEPVGKADITYVIVEQPGKIGRKYTGASQFLRAGSIVIIKIPTRLLPREERLTRAG